jgi:hypothetical protein
VVWLAYVGLVPEGFVWFAYFFWSLAKTRLSSLPRAALSAKQQGRTGLLVRSSVSSFLCPISVNVGMRVDDLMILMDNDASVCLEATC